MAKDLDQLAYLVDQYENARAERLAADKVAKELKSKETKLHDELCDALAESGVGMVGGSTHKVTLKITRKPQAADWPALYEYIKQNNAFELLQRRLGERAINERLEQGEDIPGLSFFNKRSLSVSKL